MSKCKRRANKVIAAYISVFSNVAKQFQLSFVNLYQAMIPLGNLFILCCGQRNNGWHFGAIDYGLLADTLIEKSKVKNLSIIHNS